VYAVQLKEEAEPADSDEAREDHCAKLQSELARGAARGRSLDVMPRALDSLGEKKRGGRACAPPPRIEEPKTQITIGPGCRSTR
jgi:hypothetical protein